MSFVSGLESPADFKTQCAWALGNLAADSAACRAVLRQAGAVPPLVAGALPFPPVLPCRPSIESCHADHSVLSSSRRAAGLHARGGAHELELVKISAWGLSNLARGASAEESGVNDCREAGGGWLVAAGVLPPLVGLLGPPHTHTHTHTFHTLTPTPTPTSPPPPPPPPLLPPPRRPFKSHVAWLTRCCRVAAGSLSAGPESVGYEAEAQAVSELGWVCCYLTAAPETAVRAAVAKYSTPPQLAR